MPPLVTGPPGIPATRKCEPGELLDHLTLWVRSGTAHVRLATGEDYRIDAGTGICLPPGTEHDVWTEPSTLTVPMFSPQCPVAAPAETVVAIEIAPDLDAALIEHFSQWAWQDVPAFGQQEWGTLDLAARRVCDDAVPLAPPPRHGPAARVAGALVRAPSIDHTLDDWAAWAACSPSTLRRAFLAQTGMTFVQWRQLIRLEAAARLIADGSRVGEAAARVGFASRWGFGEAFRAQYGMAPREWAASRGGDAVGEPGSAAPTAVEPDEPLPDNVMVWVRAGELRARYAGRSWAGRAGDVVWLPAGAVLEATPESSIPLSMLCTECVQLDRPERARFSHAWQDWLLWASVSTNTLLRAHDHHGRTAGPQRLFHRHVVDAFTSQLAVERARTVPLPEEPRARAAAEAFLHALGTTSEGRTHAVPTHVHADFQRETGMSFAQWRLAARMRAARRLLHRGVPASSVATRVGYTMLSNFSRAFTRFHGIGPREFQALEGPEDQLRVG